MKRQHKISISVFLLLIMLSIGCASKRIKDNFISREKIPANFEYVTDVIVNKEGYHFLWVIPFASANEEAAEEMMKKVTKDKYPDAAGVYEVEEIHRQGVGLFDWRPSITLVGKVVKKR